MGDHQLTPLIKGPITDIFGSIGNYQTHPECWERELALVDCLEAYGPLKGQQKCEVLFADMRECVLKGKQRQRYYIMRNERLRQIKDGERSKENGYIPAPPSDMY